MMFIDQIPVVHFGESDAYSIILENIVFTI